MSHLKVKKEEGAKTFPKGGPMGETRVGLGNLWYFLTVC